jgi:hypothetical protein
MRLFDTFIFLFAIAPGFALFLLFLPLIKAKVNLPNRKGRKRIIRMNPMPWEWIEEKGMLSHVLLLNYNIEYAIGKDNDSKK